MVEVVVLWAILAKRAKRLAFAMMARSAGARVPQRFGAVLNVFDSAARNSRSTAPPGSSSQMANFLIRLKGLRRRATAAPLGLLLADRS